MTYSPIRPLILIVEDQTEMTQRLTELLNRAGYQTTVALNRNEALMSVLTRQPDLALIDLASPDGDDIVVMCELHVIDPDLPTIIITRSGSPEEARTAMISGALDFYTCQFDSRELLASVAEALLVRRVRAAPASRKTLDALREASRV